MATKQLEKRQAKDGREQFLRPHCSVIEVAGGDILVKIEMPGVSKDNLEIDVDSNELHVTGKRPTSAPSGDPLVSERFHGSYYQAFTLDDTIDRQRIDAVLEAGLLTLRLHRKESEKPRRIQVKA
jgi:HSP20 family protein